MAMMRLLPSRNNTASRVQFVIAYLSQLLRLGGIHWLFFLKKFDKEFCDGAMESQAPVIASALRKMELGSPASMQFCVSFLGVCDIPQIDEWTVSLPPLEKGSVERNAVSGKKPLQKIQYSDVHLDPLYTDGASTDCEKPTCCR